MKKIHARLSVEIEVTDEEFDELLEEYDGDDMEIPEDWIDRAKPSNWDDGGYIPGDWFQADIDIAEGRLLP